LIQADHPELRGHWPLNEHIPLWGFVDDQAFLTKLGPCLVLEVEGRRLCSCLDPDELERTPSARERPQVLDPSSGCISNVFRRDRPELIFPPRLGPIVDAAIRQRIAHLESKARSLPPGHVLRRAFPGLPSPIRARQDPALPGRPREAFELIRAQFSSGASVTLIEREIQQALAVLRQRLFTLQHSSSPTSCACGSSASESLPLPAPARELRPAQGGSRRAAPRHPPGLLPRRHTHLFFTPTICEPTTTTSAP